MHIITGLGTGGAEMMLCKLISFMDRKQFLCRVLTLEPPGVLGRRIEKLGIQVDSLYIHPDRPNPLTLLKAIRMMRQWNPHVVQTWMYHADLLGMIAWWAYRRGELIWNIRCTNMDFSNYRWTTRWVMKICAIFSRTPYMVVANSHASIQDHRKMGYHLRRFKVIPNGFDLTLFKPDPVLRVQIRNELKVADDALCIGLVARFDPMKDHATFFSAAKIIGSKRPNTHLILCGEGITWDNPKLRILRGNLGSSSKLHMLGRRDDMNRIMAGLDILVSASAYGEGFSNVIGEAMACGVPCVVTDVGDSARIVGETGKVVPSSDPSVMAQAVLELLDLPVDKRHALALSVREKIQNRYSLDKIVAKYEKLYLEAASQKTDPG